MDNQATQEQQTVEQPQNQEGNLPQPEQQVDQANQSSQQKEPEDLLSRVTKFIETESPSNKSDEQIDTDIYNDAEFRQKIDAIEDPQLKEYLTQLRKSGVRGVSEKLKEISEIRKEVQALKEGTQQGWTAERVQSLLSDPEFLRIAQQMTGTQSQEDDDEYVPESVKAKLAKLDQMEKQMQAWQNSQIQQNFEQQHNQLSSKYGNYDRNRVDEIRKELLEGKTQATNEHIYKAFYHDENVKRAYELGRKDAQQGVSEKETLSSFGGVNQVQNQEIKPEKEESNKKFWNRIVDKQLNTLNKK